MRALSTVSVLGGTALLAVAAAGCGGAGPDAVARGFLSDWSRAHYAQAARLTDGDETTVSVWLSSFAERLGASHLSLRLVGVQTRGDQATARFRAEIALAGLGSSWRYAGALSMRQRGGRWKVGWQPADLYPALAAGERLVTVRTLPPRAPLLDRTGNQLERLTPVVTVGVVPSLLKRPKQTIGTLAGVLHVDGGALARMVDRTPRYQFLPVITLRRAAYERVKPAVHPLAGVHFQTGVLPLGPTPGFGRAVLGQVGTATTEALRSAGSLALPTDQIGVSGLQQVYQQRLAGRPSGQVEVVDASGRLLATPFSVSGHEGAPVRTTLSLQLQKAAEAALPQKAARTALVAVQASTGQILAVANRPAQSTEDLALDSSLPPGSTFKVITTAALLARGFDPQSRVPCPPEITVEGKRFTNFEGESGPGASFGDDFAQSCNAAFISLAPRLAGGALTSAARQFGFGSRWQLPLASYSGQAPPPASRVERAAEMIGQGRVLASPLNMALVAAAVDSGAWRPPELVTDPPPGRGGSPNALSPGVTAALRTLMRAVVTAGTGTAANVPGGPVYGKTGTAEEGSGNPPATDAWFIGFRGDLAFAVVVPGGGVGGQVAAPIAARFLQAAPASAVR